MYVYVRYDTVRHGAAGYVLPLRPGVSRGCSLRWHLPRLVDRIECSGTRRRKKKANVYILYLPASETLLAAENSRRSGWDGGQRLESALESGRTRSDSGQSILFATIYIRTSEFAVLQEGWSSSQGRTESSRPGILCASRA